MIEYPYAVGGVVTRVLEAGPDDGTTTVLVHGVGARADRWRHNIGPLADAGLHVYALDLPGHGFAAKGADFDYSIDGYGAFVTDFLGSVTAEPAILIGTSIGGHVLAAVMCTAPDRVGALVLVGSLGLVPLGADRREAMFRSLTDASLEGTRRKLLRVNHDPTQITDAWVAEEFKVNNSPGARESLAAIGAYIGEEIDNDLVGYRLDALDPRPPIQLVWGEEDVAVPLSMGLTAQEFISGLDVLVTIPGAGHLPYREAPNRFNQAVLGFLHDQGIT